MKRLLTFLVVLTLPALVVAQDKGDAVAGEYREYPNASEQGALNAES